MWAAAMVHRVSARERGQQRNVHMIDVNERAIGLAKENTEAKSVFQTLKSMKVIGYENVKEAKFAAFLTNPPIRAGKKVVHEI